MRWITRLASR